MFGIAKYYRDVSCRAVKSAWAICGYISGVLSPVCGYVGYKHPDWGATVNNALWIVPLCIFPVLLFIGFIVTPYKMDKERKREIDDLQKQLYGAKQEIRTFLESINPKILQKVDEGQKEICAGIGALKQMELAELSKRQGFGNLLLFRKGSNLGYLHTANGKFGPLILELGQMGILEEYYFYPKDALIK